MYIRGHVRFTSCIPLVIVLQMIKTYTEAVRTIDPKLAVGKFGSLWVDFAKLYEDNGRLDDARKIFDRAVNVHFRRVSPGTRDTGKKRLYLIQYLLLLFIGMVKHVNDSG